MSPSSPVHLVGTRLAAQPLHQDSRSKESSASTRSSCRPAGCPARDDQRVLLSSSLVIPNWTSGPWLLDIMAQGKPVTGRRSPQACASLLKSCSAPQVPVPVWLSVSVCPCVGSWVGVGKTGSQSGGEDVHSRTSCKNVLRRRSLVDACEKCDSRRQASDPGKKMLLLLPFYSCSLLLFTLFVQ